MYYTRHLTSPLIFRKWAAISAISGALERKVWCRINGRENFPNLYIFLVGGPGVGKSQATIETQNMWDSLENHYVAPSSVTKASLIDHLDEAKRSITRVDQVPAVITYNAVLVAAHELGVLIPAYDNEFMAALTDLWDCQRYTERRRTRNTNISIERSYLSLIAGCTPGYLTGTLPEGAWDQGFMSRVIMIYSGDRVLKSMFSEDAKDESEQEFLQKELKQISELQGKFMFTEEARDFLDQWHMQDGQPAPTHPKLMYYNMRRSQNLVKLCMIAAVASRKELVITLDDAQRALDWLTEAELYMPDVFKAMANTSHAQLLDDIWHFIYNAHVKGGKKGVAESRVIGYVGQRAPAHAVKTILEVMQNAKLVSREIGDTTIVYVPLGKEP